MIQLVFAHCNGAFGSTSGMPWPHISQDFKNFKLNTDNTVLVMGAKTFESLPTILKGRRHVVLCDLSRAEMPLTKDGSRANQYLDYSELDDHLSKWKKSSSLYSVIGGADLLEKSLPYAMRIIETKIIINPLGNVKLEPVTKFLSTDFTYDLNKLKVYSSKEFNISNDISITQLIKFN